MVQAGFNINGSYKAAWQGLNYQKGVLMFQEDGHTANYDCETTKENLEFLQSLYDEYQVGAVNFGDDRELSFGNNQTAMIYDWGSYVGTLATNYPDVNYGVFPTPAFSEETPFAYDRYNGESTPASTSTRAMNRRPSPRISSVSSWPTTTTCASPPTC